MVFNDFMPLIHRGVNCGFYLVNAIEGYCIECKDRTELFKTLKQNGFLSDIRYQVTGVSVHENKLIIEFLKR